MKKPVLKTLAAFCAVLFTVVDGFVRRGLAAMLFAPGKMAATALSAAVILIGGSAESALAAQSDYDATHCVSFRSPHFVNTCDDTIRVAWCFPDHPNPGFDLNHSLDCEDAFNNQVWFRSAKLRPGAKIDIYQWGGSEYRSRVQQAACFGGRYPRPSERRGKHVCR